MIVAPAIVALAADQHFNHGCYTDDMILTLRRMRRAVGGEHETHASAPLKQALDEGKRARAIGLAKKV